MNDLLILFKALSDRNRLRIVFALMHYDELCACQLTELIQVTSATSSRHLANLITAKIISSRKNGRWVHYRLCREISEKSQLLEWIETQFKKDPKMAQDFEELKKITKREPEDICRKQRGDKCCPSRAC